MPYLIATNTVHVTYEIKKSVFYGRARYVKNRQEAMAYLGDVKMEFPDARHHCWAYLLGDPVSPISAAMNDDGEPSNTAGKPILNVLQHKGIGDIMLVVARYFGGVKLGAGGLVRAYSTTAQMTIEQVQTVLYKTLTRFNVKTDFKYEQVLRHFVSTNQGTVDDCTYTNQVCLTISIPEECKQSLLTLAGNIHAEVHLSNP